MEDKESKKKEESEVKKEVWIFCYNLHDADFITLLYI